MATSLAISTKRLRKVFGDKVAVRDLTLEVQRGEVFGFLGPNGAGKSTSLKMLLGLVAPTSGSAELLGFPIRHRETRAKVGFLPEHFRFYEWLTAPELVRLHGELSGVTRGVLRQRVPEVLELVGLASHASKQIRQYSKGMLQRAGLAQALINEPEILFLDEPTSGLDPVGRRLVREIIRLQRDRGATVFLNSHLLSEVEVTCDRVAFIKGGEVMEVRCVRDFDAEHGCVVAQVCGLTPEILNNLHVWATHLEQNGTELRLRLKDAEHAPQVLRYLVESGARIYSFTPQRRSLEDRFLEILGTDGGL